MDEQNEENNCEYNNESNEEDDDYEGQDEQTKLIAEEYKVWKKNTPFLYDLIVTNALEWPSLTVEWLSKKIEIPGKDYSEQQLLLGTHTSDDEQNYLMIAKMRLPNQEAEIDDRHYDEEKQELGSYGGNSAKFEISVKINHDGEINRARAMPQDEFLVATKTVQGSIYVFDISKHSSTPSSDGVCKPNLVLVGHETEGYGLDWNKLHKGMVLSGADDARICRFDINARPINRSEINAVANFKAHDDVINDVRWHCFTGDIYGSVSEDSNMKIWDVRDETKPAKAVIAHSAAVQCIAFSPFNQFLIVTAGADNLVKLWDMRNMSHALHDFEGHKDSIVQVQWSPFNEAFFASCAEDRRLIIWDLSKIGDEQTSEEAEDGPPELLFTHGGHSTKISDFGWNKNDPWILTSVSEDNVVQTWQPTKTIYAPETLEEAAKKVTMIDIST